MSVTDPKGDDNRVLVNDKYTICSTIGKGAYGICYTGIDVGNGQRVAIKVDPKKKNSLLYEIKIYRHYLTDLADDRTAAIPALLWSGDSVGLGHVMVMDLLGPNLEKLFNNCNRKLTTKTIVMIAVQCIDVLEEVHNRGLIHRDIKPENFLIGSSGVGGCDRRAKRIHIIDFGLAKPWRDRRTGQHIPYTTGVGMTGTPRYCSVAAGNGKEQSRRDDLESVGYMLAYFVQGRLPWQGLHAPKGTGRPKRNEAICAVKDMTSVQKLFEDMPSVFPDFLSAAKQLAFDEEPDYRHWTDRLRQLVDEFDYQYDWDQFYDTTTAGLTQEVIG